MKNYGDLEGFYPPRPTASTDNTPLDLIHYHSHSLIVKYILFKQASLAEKVMLFDKKPLCAFFSDLDECTTASHSCDVNSLCQNTVGSYACSCNAGYTGDGKPCNGI